MSTDKTGRTIWTELLTKECGNTLYSINQKGAEIEEVPVKDGMSM
jgi:hypothetical protein